jgi:hypothetical protein
MDFKNATVTYNIKNGVKQSIQVRYPEDSNGSRRVLSVPLDEDNRHYQAILKWVAKGNTIDEADA